jgi:hypothetical protein
MGPCWTTFADTAPTPLATTDVDVGSGRSGVQDSARRTQFDPYYTNDHESDMLASSDGVIQATGVSHHEDDHSRSHDGGDHSSGEVDHLHPMANHPSVRGDHYHWTKWIILDNELAVMNAVEFNTLRRVNIKGVMMFGTVNVEMGLADWHPVEFKTLRSVPIACNGMMTE